jgi:hypothetical protein
MVSIKDLKPGDELCANYNLYTYPKTGVWLYFSIKLHLIKASECPHQFLDMYISYNLHTIHRPVLNLLLKP